jgi:conjugative transfer pilus assembly protein TraH
MQTAANKYLNMNMDSCRAAARLVGGALKHFDQEKANCIATRQNDHGEDFSTASFACTTGGSRQSTVGLDGEKNKLDVVEGNLAWYVLMQDPFFQADTQFAEVVMNIIGTMIISKGVAEDAPDDIRILEPAIKESVKHERFNNIYNALFHGTAAINNLLIYRCSDGGPPDPNGCTEISNDLVTITPTWDGLYARVDSLIRSIIQKINGDVELTPQEKGLIRSSNMPIYRFLSAATTYFPQGTDPSSIYKEYTTLIAQEILLRSLDAVIQKAEQRSANLKNGISEATRIKEFRDDLKGVTKGLAELRKNNEFSAEKMLAMQESIMKYERALLPKLSSGIVTASMWGK